MAGTITSSGLGSGLAIGDLVKSLVDSDKSAKTNQIAKQTTLNTTKLSGISTLNSALDAFQTALTNLGKTDTPAFNGFSATSSLATALTVTAKNTAVAGTYAVEVKTLATSSSVASASFDTATASAIPSGSLTITQNSVDTAFNIPEGSTLQSVRDLINTKTSTSGISANIITDASGSRLVFGSTKTGAGSDITTSSSISGLTIGSGALDASDATSAGRIGNAPIDGEITVGGLSIKSSTNTYDTAVSGLSFTAVAKGVSTVTVGANSDGLKTSLQAFVDAYNTVVSTINTLTKATTDSNGDLTGVAALGGDSLARDLLATMRSVLNDTSSGGKLSTLSQLGIQTDQAGGKLSFDAGKYTAAMAKGMGGEVQQLFAGTKDDGSDGLLKRMSKALDPYTSTGGVMDIRTTQLNKTKADLLAQKAALDLRVETLTATLTAKYNAMDLAVGQMKSTLSSITSFFDALNARTSAS
ncbi:Flagellar hook-associated protein 2 [Pseudomonas savastanoi pv. glycinea]|nr:Flagellar hook-associated protein 2 [Pseudomonas savastanoi pv. glycinea]